MVKLLYFVRAALAGIRASPFVHFVAALTLAVALFSLGLARYGYQATRLALAAWGSQVEVTLYLTDATSPEEGRALAEQIWRADGASARFIPREEALARLRQELGEAGDVLTDLPKNPLPASVEARLPAGLRTSTAIAGLAARWAKLPGVESVEYGREWVERIEALGRAVRGAGVLLLLAVVVAAVVVVAAALQLAIASRREEIEIQKLVGATDAFVKAPFLLEGVFQGLLGAALACGGLLVLARSLGPHLSRAAAFVAQGLSFPPLLDWRSGLELLGAGAALGLAGSLLAVRRFLRV